MPPAAHRGPRLVLVALGLFALLTIVAFASRAGFGANSRAEPSQKYLDYAFSIFFVLFVLAAPIALYAYYLQRREIAAERRGRRRPFLQALGLVVLFSGLALLLRSRLHGHNPFERLRRTSLPGAARKAHGHQPVAQIEPHFRWPVLVAFGVLLVLAVAAFFVARRRRTRRVARRLEQPEVRAELAQAISDAIADLDAEPDPRRAVIAAYARMELVFARHGLPRRPSETPFEYLARVLLDLRARAESVRRLTTLFERAKFSLHDIDAPMKRDAIGALAEIRDDLRAAAA